VCEDQVARFGFRVAGKAGFHKRFVARLAIGREVTESPAAGRSVLCRVFDHKLNIRRLPGNKGLVAPEDFVVFLRRGMAEVQSGDDCAVREREFPVTIGLDRYIIPQNGSQTVEVPLFVRHGNHLPVAVSRRNLGNEARDGRLIRAPERASTRHKNTSHGSDGNQQEYGAFQNGFSFLSLRAGPTLG